VRARASAFLSRPIVALALCGVGLAIGIVLLVPATRVILTSAKGHQAALIHLRPLAEPSRVYDSQGNLLAVLQDADYRVSLSLAYMSPEVRHAVIDVEDNTFYYHGAVDVRSIFRALTADISSGHVVQGGSTITQQLVKNSLLTPQRSLTRKLHEAILAYQLEHQMTKTQILERYLNTIYFGNGAYGVEAAAETYFGKHAGQLDAPQAAMLAAMISNPAAYDPIGHPVAAGKRRAIALDDMVAAGDLTQQAADLSKLAPLPTKIHGPPVPPESAFVQEVKLGLLNDKSDYPGLGRTRQERFNALFRGGLSITTTLDPAIQADATKAVKDQLPDTGGRFAAAVVSVDPNNGFIRALVPGNSSSEGFDVVTGRGGSGGRQPGSSFKPFVLMAALDNHHSPYDDVDGTSPCVVKFPGSPPTTLHNAEPGGGVMTVAQATTNSVNCAYVRIGLAVGLNKVVDMAHRLGVRSPLQAYPSTSIGGQDVTPLEMASAYATLADNGVYHRPSAVTKIVDRQGKVLYQASTKGTQVVPTWEAQVTTQVLRTVVESGTGTAAALSDRPVAGKTGTTDNFGNAWFIGYTPQIVSAVWMGSPVGIVPMNDVGGSTVFGGTYPARIWHELMGAALANYPVVDFPQPDYSQLPPPTYINTPYAPGAAPFVPGSSPAPTFTVPPGFVPVPKMPTPPTTTPPPSTTTTVPPSTTTTGG
jgi:membrane peptidoglycan carboxypeptidase